MTLEVLRIKEALRNLIDAYAYLGDEKKIAEQMNLFTPDLKYRVYMDNTLVADVSGRANMERDFNEHASRVKTYFTLNGQHTVNIDGDTATGVSFTQIKMIRAAEGKDNITDYSVRYDDKYVCQDEQWLIKERTGYFTIIEARSIG